MDGSVVLLYMGVPPSWSIKSGDDVPTAAEPVPPPVVVKYANAAPPTPMATATATPTTSSFLFTNRLRFMLLLIHSMDGWTAD
jgi:hypothetical protein